MLNVSNYQKGIKIWVPHETLVWESAVILEDCVSDHVHLFVIQTEDSHELKTITVDSVDKLPPLCLPQDSALNDRCNLTSLTIRHEATIFNALRTRFNRQCIYNYCGITTVIFNPHVRLSINDNETLWSYRGQSLRNVEPHIFAVAEKIYRKLERENDDQSIIFTGESGSGKTENAEYATLYLVRTTAKDSQVKEKILATSTILQAFGNAKTEKNDNSSRFAKLIEIQYDKNFKIVGACLKAYLIDKSRVTVQAENEQNFNIFYQLQAAKEEPPNLYLNETNFNYLNNGKYSEVEIENNIKKYNEVVRALSTLGFSGKQQDEIMRILAAVLHLGNLNFKRREGEELNDNQESCYIFGLNYLETMVKVFGLEAKSIKIVRKWMCHRRIFFNQNEILQPMSLEQAIKARDSLAKFIYTKLFNWIITRLNAFFRSPCNVQTSIAIFDMYGFENLKFNLFEQFCINYANEKIQQYVVHSIFVLQQEEYNIEEIDWTYIKYRDNKLCIKLIEGKNGIIDVLEEESKNLKNSNTSWIENLYLKNEKSENFEASKENATNFIIHHYLSTVEYFASDFVEKNRDSPVREQLGMLKDTKNDLLNKLIFDEYFKLSLPKGRIKTSTNKRVSLSIKHIKRTVASEIQNSLNTILSTLSKTSTHYVRCIKSNDDKKPFEFNSQCVIEQIRALNITDIIEISVKGYFCQQTYEQFYERYHCLCQLENITRNDLQDACKIILNIFVQDFEFIKFGKTKLFIKEDIIEDLEILRANKRQEACIVIQKVIRCFLGRKRYENILRTVCGLQYYARKYLARQQVKTFRQELAAVDESRYQMHKYASQSVIGERQIIMDNQQCIQANNRIMNQLLFSKIQTLKELRGREEKPLQIPQVKPKPRQLCKERRAIDCSTLDLFLTLIQEDGDCESYQELFQIFFIFDEHVEKVRNMVGLQKPEIEVLKKLNSTYELTDNESKVRKNEDTDINDQYTLQSSSKEMEEINYKGMLQLNSEDVDTLMSRLIVELDPATIIEISPHLPAQILFMCIRYLDKQNYYLTVQAVIENFTKTIRFIIKHRKHFETMILWLANVHELMIYFKQFSKKDLKNLYNYQMCNTNRQAQQCLYNLDLAVEYNSLHELGQWIVKKALKQVKTHMLELIVPGLLENDEIVPLDQDIQESSEQLPLQKLHQLLKEFSCIHESFKKCNLHRKMIMQYFNQLFEFINSIALSNIMSRREMCTSYKGFRIRCNIRHLERWAANHQLLSTIHALRPVIEAARLLQMQLIDQSDIVWISEKFNKLNSNQIIKLLDLFQSNNEQDMKIDNCLLHTQLKERLQRRVELDDTIILQAEKSMINFVFEYSDVCLADIEIPSVFNLTMLKKI